MDDEAILTLYFARNQEAIQETERKYGAYCRRISQQILGSREDAEECVNDTWLQAWNKIPPQRPQSFQAFLGCIARNLSLDRWDRRQAKKRGGGQTKVLLSELEACLPSPDVLERRLEEQELGRILSRWLFQQPEKNRVAFVRRYWYADSLAETAARIGCTTGAAKSLLHRMRHNLRNYLVKEGAWK